MRETDFKQVGAEPVKRGERLAITIGDMRSTKGALCIRGCNGFEALARAVG